MSTARSHRHVSALRSITEDRLRGRARLFSIIFTSALVAIEDGAVSFAGPVNLGDFLSHTAAVCMAVISVTYTDRLMAAGFIKREWASTIDLGQACKHWLSLLLTTTFVEQVCSTGIEASLLPHSCFNRTAASPSRSTTASPSTRCWDGSLRLQVHALEKLSRWFGLQQR